MKPTSIILIEARREAPVKPVLGAACNGCGVCCLVTPCPLARVWLRQWRGACRALVWDAPASRYASGLVQHPRQYPRWLPAWLERLLDRHSRAGSPPAAAAMPIMRWASE